MTIGEYIDKKFSLKDWMPWGSEHLQGFRDCPLKNEPGQDAKRIVDAVEKLIRSCEPIRPLNSREKHDLLNLVRDQLETIWCG